MPYTYYLTGCTQDDIEDCYYRGEVNNIFVKNVEAGDTIVLPAGSAEWGDYNRGNNGRIYFILPITVRGQGDSTIITLAENGSTYVSGIINLWSTVTFADMKIIGANTRPVTAFVANSLNNSGVPGGINFTGGFRITNVTYEGRSGGAYVLYFTPGITSGGLIDNCRCSASVGNTELFFGRGPTNAWQLNNTIGTSSNIFIEDCTFSNNGYVCDANSNAYMVVRFCTISSPQKVDGHGVASNTPARSYRNMEVYHNTWTYPTAGGWTAIEMRGATFMLFNNLAAGFAGAFYLTDYGYLGLWGNFGNVYQTPVNYPITDQIGVGKDPKVAGSEPAYLWGNKNNTGAAWPRALKSIPQGAIDQYRTQTGDPNSTFTEKTMIQANRDFYASAGFDSDGTGVSVGTRAEMDALTPAFAKYGFWVTNEGSWNKTPGGQQGRLYTWSGSAWTLSYEPYTYPHPLRGFVASQRQWKRLTKFPKFKVYAE
jgi:hypothetical protein